MTAPLTYWSPPYSTGSKKRDAAFVAARLEQWRPVVIGLPFAGFARELMDYGGPARLVVGESDPALQAFWFAATLGQLEVAGARALELWQQALEEAARSTAADPVQRAWKALTSSEPRGFGPERAAWMIAVASGGRNAGRRRNKRGEWNWPYAPKNRGVRDPEWLPRRTPSAEALRASNAWVQSRVLAVVNSWQEALMEASARVVPEGLQDAAATARLELTAPTGFDSRADWTRVALLVDKPYGKCKTQLYDGRWTQAQDDALAAAVCALARCGARVVTWIGEDDLEPWLREAGDASGLKAALEAVAAEVARAAADSDAPAVPVEMAVAGWQFKWRPARTHMKSASKSGDGAQASGGWMGWTQW